MDTLEPLIQVSKRIKRPKALQVSSSFDCVELTLKTTTSVLMQIVAYGIPYESPSGFKGNLVCFHSLASMQHVLANLKRYRQLRKQFIDAKSEAADFQSDLLLCVNEAMAICDTLIDDSIRIRCDIKTPSLIATTTPKLLALLSYLLIEAADFCCSNGTIGLRGVLDSKHKTELVILAERTALETKSLHPLEQILIRNSYPNHYNVTVSDEEPTVKLLSSGERTLSKLVSRHNKGVKLGDNASPSALSENMQRINFLASETSVELQVRRPNSEHLSFYLALPILTSEG